MVSGRLWTGPLGLRAGRLGINNSEREAAAPAIPGPRRYLGLGVYQGRRYLGRGVYEWEERYLQAGGGEGYLRAVRGTSLERERERDGYLRERDGYLGSGVGRVGARRCAWV